MNNKVFISSTIYDLIDVRRELYEFFKKMNLEPIMSDIPDSKFEILTNKNSIETCLLNLSQCDHIIFIFSQRYGPSLEKVGFGDYSATHLEYNYAKAKQKKIHVYVRDRLEADFSIWKKNNKNRDIDYAWIDKKNLKLFDLLGDHSKLSKEKPHSNWYKIFKDSFELKEFICSDFKLISANLSIKNLLAKNDFPLIQPKLNVEIITAHRQQEMVLTTKLKNISNSTAFNFHIEWLTPDIKFNSKEKVQDIDIFVPGEETNLTAFYTLGHEHLGPELDLLIRYSNVDGFELNEIYKIKAKLQTGTTTGIISGCILQERKFKVSKPTEITICA